MNTKEIESIESYFKTENEHWNGYALKTIRKALEKQLFSDFNDKKELTTEQKVHLLEGAFEYLDHTDFEGWYSNEVQDLMKSQIAVYNNELKNQVPEYGKPLTGSIRDTLKQMMQTELEQLPSTLKELDPVQRLNILCKLMPYVLPKTESVKHNLGEPDEFKMKRWHD
jgi:hypothetical protein